MEFLAESVLHILQIIRPPLLTVPFPLLIVICFLAFLLWKISNTYKNRKSTPSNLLCSWLQLPTRGQSFPGLPSRLLTPASRSSDFTQNIPVVNRLKSVCALISCSREPHTRCSFAFSQNSPGLNSSSLFGGRMPVPGSSAMSCVSPSGKEVRLSPLCQ